MTETSAFPFGDTEPVDPSAEQAEETGTRRVLVMAGGVVAALALAAGGFLFLTGDEEPVEEAFVAPRPAVAAQAVGVTKKVATKPAAKLPAPFEDDLGRNPFKALYVEPVAAAGPATDPTLPGGGTTAGGPVAPEAPTAKEYALVLKRVYGEGKDQTAEFTIDGRKVVAKIGVRFGPTSEIRLISLQEGPKDGQWTAVLQVGDGEPFDAVTGDTVSVR